MLRTPATAAVLLLTALAAGCSGDGEADNDTSAEDTSSQSPAPEESEGSGDAADGSGSEFCEAFSAIGAVEDFEGARKPFAELEKVGVPGDAPEDAADGLVIFTDVLERADDEADLNRLGEKVPQKDQQKVAAFFRYGTESCLAPPAAPAPQETPAG